MGKQQSPDIPDVVANYWLGDGLGAGYSGALLAVGSAPADDDYQAQYGALNIYIRSR